MIQALREANAFVLLSRSRQRCQTEWFVLSFDFCERDCKDVIELGVSSSTLYLGFVLPKKLIKRAVDRNKIKRWVRSAVVQRPHQRSVQVLVRPRVRLDMRSMAVRSRVREEILSLIAQWQNKLAHVG